MSWVGPLISAAGSVLGGVLGAKSQKDANEENAKAQREFAQQGIRWRVEDAKAAGLHPLYALGGSGATFSPSAQPVMDGQNVARAASALASGVETEMQKAQLDAVRASAAKDYALAAAADSEAARRSQQTMPPVAESFPVSLPGVSLVPNSREAMITDPLASAGYPTPLPPIERGPNYLTGDIKPGFQRYNTSIAGEIILPAGGSMSEAVESMENPVIQAWIVAENLKHYGPGAVSKLKAFLGPNFKWWTDPAGAIGDRVRSFGAARAAQGGN